MATRAGWTGLDHHASPADHREMTTWPGARCPRSSSTATWRGRCGRPRWSTWPGATGSPCRPPTRRSSTATTRSTASSRSSGWCSRRSGPATTGRAWDTSRCVDAASWGVVHRESFFTPARHLAAGQDLADVVAGLDEGMAAAEQETGTTCLLIADIDRAYGPEAGLATGRATRRAPARRRPRHRAGGRRGHGLDRARHRSRHVRPGVRRCPGRRPAAHRPPGRELARRARSPPVSTCSGSSASTTLCPCSTTPTSPPACVTSGSASRSARPPTSGSPTPSPAWPTTPSPGCTTPACSPRSTPTTRR